MSIEELKRETFLEMANSGEIAHNSDNEEWINVLIQTGADFIKKEYEEKLRWIQVEEAKPEIDESLSKSDLHYSISVEVKNGIKIQSAYFNIETGQWRSLITGGIINPTHWRRFL